MKKAIISFSLIAALLVSFSACGQQTGVDELQIRYISRLDIILIKLDNAMENDLQLEKEQLEYYKQKNLFKARQLKWEI